MEEAFGSEYGLFFNVEYNRYDAHAFRGRNRVCQSFSKRFGRCKVLKKNGKALASLQAPVNLEKNVLRQFVKRVCVLAAFRPMSPNAATRSDMFDDS